MCFFGEFWLTRSRYCQSQRADRVDDDGDEEAVVVVECLEKNEHVPPVFNGCTETLNMDDHFLDK